MDSIRLSLRFLLESYYLSKATSSAKSYFDFYNKAIFLSCLSTYEVKSYRPVDASAWFALIRSC